MDWHAAGLAHGHDVCEVGDDMQEASVRKIVLRYSRDIANEVIVVRYRCVMLAASYFYFGKALDWRFVPEKQFNTGFWL